MASEQIMAKALVRVFLAKQGESQDPRRVEELALQLLYRYHTHTSRAEDVAPKCSGQNEWTKYERSRNRVQPGEAHQVLEQYGNVDLMQGPVPYRPKPAPSKEGRDQSEDYRVGAQYQVVGHEHERHGRVWAIYNWFGQRVTGYFRSYDLAHARREYWQKKYEQYGQYLKGTTTLEEVLE